MPAPFLRDYPLTLLNNPVSVKPPRRACVRLQDKKLENSITRFQAEARTTTTSISDRSSFESIYARQPPWEIGRAMRAFLDVAEQSTGIISDAGCGTGRVAIELARRGVEVVGADLDPSMLDTARDRAPGLTWIHADLAELELPQRFDVVVMAGNVPLFTPPGSHAALIAGCARHLAAEGALVAGFQTTEGYGLDAYDAHCAAAGLELAERYATWDRAPHEPTSTSAVSVHRRVP